jgi:hypothetical protein
VETLDWLVSRLSTLEQGILSRSRTLNRLSADFYDELTKFISLYELKPVSFKAGNVNYSPELEEAEFFIFSIVEDDSLPYRLLDLHDEHAKAVRFNIDETYLYALAREDTMFEIASHFPFEKIFRGASPVFGRYALHLVNPDDSVDEFRLFRSGISYHIDQQVLTFPSAKAAYQHLRRQYRQEARDVYMLRIPRQDIDKEIFIRSFVAGRIVSESGLDFDDAKDLVMFDVRAELARSYYLSLSVIGGSCFEWSGPQGSFFYGEDMIAH